MVKNAQKICRLLADDLFGTLFDLFDLFCFIGLALKGLTFVKMHIFERGFKGNVNQWIRK